MLPAKLHDTSERAPSLQPGGEALSCRSLFWERTVLSVLEKVQRLPSDVQGNVAARVGTYIDLARTASDDATLNGFIEAAAGERAKIIEQRAKPTVDRPWATAALAEAWCIARLGLLNGSLNCYNAMSVIAAIEAFASKRATLVPQIEKDALRSLGQTPLPHDTVWSTALAGLERGLDACAASVKRERDRLKDFPCARIPQKRV